MRALFLLIPTVSGIMPLTAATATVPPIGNIANFVVKTDDLEEARRFYSGVLGYDEVFRHKRPVSGPAELSVFKVNERQYIEVSPTLQNPSDDKLIQIGYATADARSASESIGRQADPDRVCDGRRPQTARLSRCSWRGRAFPSHQGFGRQLQLYPQRP